MSAFFTAFPDLAVTPRSLVNDGSAAMAERTLGGTQDGPLAIGDGEVSPSGRTVSIPIAAKHRGIFRMCHSSGR